ncbi:hypothetical protein [Massilia varians]|uniref:hypothetical protein n=1 Tax=Massilia varians TaxID=457921 RepID=UPI002554A2DB|nr:hypothetical protein [Massilia varians]MDK6079653.1 hypothetical protein [Massilia varians]
MFGLFKKRVEINHNLVDKIARLLRLQVMLCRFQPDFIAALEKDIVRGYFIGFFDCCLQRRGVAIPDDESFFRLMVRGHETLLATYLDDIPKYTFSSLRRQDSPDFQKGMQIGGAECLSVLDKGHQPFAFPQYVHEGRGPLAA